jgi:hypothetical protein
LISGWTTVNEGAMYAVVTGSYAAEGDVFGTITDKEDSGIIDAPSFIRYA